MDPVIRYTMLPNHSRSLKGFLFDFLLRSTHFYRLSHFKLDDIEKIDGGFVAFGGSPKGGKITGKGKIKTGILDFKHVLVPLMPDFEDTADLLNIGIFSGAYDDEDEDVDADLNNLETTLNVSPIPTTRRHKDHPKDHIIRDINSAIQTRRMTKISEEHAMVSYIKRQGRINHKDYQNCLFSCFLSQIEPKKVTQALTDLSWIEAMQDELLQFRLQKV
ncbi:hypothetical protein Tco_0862964 [Tanacetum coccineum]